MDELYISGMLQTEISKKLICYFYVSTWNVCVCVRVCPYLGKLIYQVKHKDPVTSGNVGGEVSNIDSSLSILLF